MRFKELPGSNLSLKWNYVFAPAELVEAQAQNSYTKTRFDLPEAKEWLQQNYPDRNLWSQHWQVLGSIVVMDSHDLAFAFKVRWG